MHDNEAANILIDSRTLHVYQSRSISVTLDNILFVLNSFPIFYKALTKHCTCVCSHHVEECMVGKLGVLVNGRQHTKDETDQHHHKSGIVNTQT